MSAWFFTRWFTEIGHFPVAGVIGPPVEKIRENRPLEAYGSTPLS